MKKKLLLPVLILLLSCGQNKPVGSELLEEIKQDSAIKAREKELFSNIDSSYLKTYPLAPVEITSYELFDTHINVKAKNKSAKTIDGIRIMALFYNNFNEPIPSVDNHSIRLQFQNTLPPGKVSNLSTFNIEPNFSSATKVKFYISEVHFTDDSTWNFKNYVK